MSQRSIAAFQTEAPKLFQEIVDHLNFVKTKNGYENTAVREVKVKTVAGKQSRALRYFNVLKLSPQGGVLGLVSGPALFLEYSIHNQQVVLDPHVSTVATLDHFVDRFAATVRARIKNEAEWLKVPPQWPVSRTSGELYVRRSKEPNVYAGSTTGVLHPDFVADLPSFQFQLFLYTASQKPKKKR